jgi:exonuclease VII small subunit
MSEEELITSKLEAVDQPETWQESVRELREVVAELGNVIDGLERRLAALEARD